MKPTTDRHTPAKPTDPDDIMPEVKVRGYACGGKPYATVDVEMVRIERKLPLIDSTYTRDKQLITIGTDFSGSVNLSADLRVLVLLAEAIIKHAKEIRSADIIEA